MSTRFFSLLNYEKKPQGNSYVFPGVFSKASQLCQWLMKDMALTSDFEAQSPVFSVFFWKVKIGFHFPRYIGVKIPRNIWVATTKPDSIWNDSLSHFSDSHGTSPVYFPYPWMVDFYGTLPKTNIAPENRPSQKETSVPTVNFQGLC